jgi:hypothetical protein
MRGRAEADPRLPFTGCLASTEETSREAAEYAATHADTQRLRVLEVIQNQGWYGATDKEIQAFAKLEGSTQRPRRIELLKAGLIEDSGRTRVTLSGRKAVVWIAKR